MKKRTICLLLAMIMVLSIVLAGCSKTAETPAADETPATDFDPNNHYPDNIKIIEKWKA